MREPVTAAPLATGPRFQVLERQRLRPGVVLLAAVIAAGVLLALHVGLSHSRMRRFREEAARYVRGGAAGPVPPDSADDDKDDDPNQVDVIALGDPADAPVPAKRFRHSGRVHPTILVHLPRFGPEQGLIPSSPVGHLLFAWLAAFNRSNAEAMSAVLPSAASGMTSAEQMELRLATGGFSLLSAKEVSPGVLVFRLRDQTKEGGEALGTLVMRPGSEPPAVASFHLQAVAPGE